MQRAVRRSTLALLAILSLVLVFTTAARARYHPYQAGILSKIETGLVETPLPMPFYRVFVLDGELTYVGECFPRNFPKYKPEWQVKQNVQFRIEKQKLFLKRLNGKEQELLLDFTMKNTYDAATGRSTSELIPPSGNKKNWVPECH
jgi:hypothetical protein